MSTPTSATSLLRKSELSENDSTRSFLKTQFEDKSVGAEDVDLAAKKIHEEDALLFFLG